MTTVDRIVYKDRVQRMTLEMLQNVSVSAEAYDNGVIVFIALRGLGSVQVGVPYGQDDIPALLRREFEYHAKHLCLRKYLRE